MAVLATTIGLTLGCSQANAPKDTPNDTHTNRPNHWSDIVERTGDFEEAWAANWPDSVEPLGDGAVVIRSLDQGQKLDLEWAQQSSVACFPANINDAFAGNTLFFALQQPAERSLQIQAESAPDTDSSLWVIQQGGTHYDTPPDIAQAIQCETSWRAAAGESESVTLSAPDHDYNVLIGIAGQEGVDSGLVLLEIALN